jgi:DNA primase
LWSALPEGVLRRQIAQDLAAAALMPVEELLAMWSGAPPGRRSAGGNARTPEDATAPPARPASPRPTAGRRPLAAGTPTLLDRALWLLLCDSALWDTLSAASHDLLAEQAAPYGPAFAWIEQQLHEHGPQHRNALLEAMPSADWGPQGPALIQRVAAFLEPLPDVDLRAELDVVLRRLELRTVEDELKLLFESGPLSADAAERARELHERRSDLKGRTPGTA